MAVVVQQMVAARAAGVFMTLNPANGDRSKVVVESVWGLGEPLVSGLVNPDRFIVDKVTGDVVRREVADKPTEVVRDRRPAAAGHRRRPGPPPRSRRLTEPSSARSPASEARRTARGLSHRTASSPSTTARPRTVYLVQTRPETVWSRRPVRRVATRPNGWSAILATLTGGTDPTSPAQPE